MSMAKSSAAPALGRWAHGQRTEGEPMSDLRFEVRDVPTSNGRGRKYDALRQALFANPGKSLLVPEITNRFDAAKVHMSLSHSLNASDPTLRVRRALLPEGTYFWLEKRAE